MAVELGAFEPDPAYGECGLAFVLVAHPSGKRRRGPWLRVCYFRVFHGSLRFIMVAGSLTVPKQMRIAARRLVRPARERRGGVTEWRTEIAHNSCIARNLGCDSYWSQLLRGMH